MEPLMKLELPVADLPTVSQLFYQPIKGKATSMSVEQQDLKRKVFTTAIDGQAVSLGVALRDLQTHGIGASHEVKHRELACGARDYRSVGCCRLNHQHHHHHHHHHQLQQQQQQ